MILNEITETNYQEKLSKGQLVVYEKFAKWDRIKKLAAIKDKNIFEDKELKAKALSYLRDPTIWAYAFLRDKQGNPLRLRGFQDEFINDQGRYVICTAANQIGKTWGNIVKIIHHALNVNSASVLIVSKSEDQAKNVLDEIKWIFKRSTISFKEIIEDVENRAELHITSPDGKSVSVIRCFPPTTRILGYPSTLTICDEMAFWEVTSMSERGFFTRVITSRSNETKNWSHDFLTMGQIVLISNPNGERGEFHRIWREDNRFHKYRNCWLANPNNSLEEYNEAKENTLSHDFDSVYAATFSSAKGGYILRSEYDDAEKFEFSPQIPTRTILHIGLDKTGEDTVSKQTDTNVLNAFYEIPPEKEGDKSLFRQCYVMTWKGNSYIYNKENGTKGNAIYDEIRRLVETYSVSGIAYDKPGVGDAVKNDLINEGILPESRINSLTYSMQNKTDVYNNLKFLFEQRRLQLQRIPEQREQFMGLKFERLDSGNMKVHHKREGMHDDYPDSVANALYQANLNKSMVSFNFIPHQGVDDSEEKKPMYKRDNIICDECDSYKPSSQPDKKLCDDCYVDTD